MNCVELRQRPCDPKEKKEEIIPDSMPMLNFGFFAMSHEGRGHFPVTKVTP